MQQVYSQHLSSSQQHSVPSSDARRALLQWLQDGRRGRWLVVIDNVIPRVLKYFMTMLNMQPPPNGDVLVTTRASGARVQATVAFAVCVQRDCLGTADAAVVVWRLVCEYNAQHGTRCGHGPHLNLDPSRPTPELEPPVVPRSVPQELRQLRSESPTEYAALLKLAKASDFGFGGLPLALVTGAGALCIRRLSFSQFLTACENGAVRDNATALSSSLAGIWELSRPGLSQAAQELMRIVSYYPPDCTMEEVLVWGCLPGPETSSIARRFADAKAVSTCNCMGCAAQQRRQVVAALALELEGASLVKRRVVAASEVLPRHCLVTDESNLTKDSVRSRREYACLSIHRVVQEVVRSRNVAFSPPLVRAVDLAWRSSLTCGDAVDVACGPPCANSWVPPVAVMRVIAARHVAEIAPRINLDAAITVLSRKPAWVGDMHLTVDASTREQLGHLCTRVALLRRLCELAALLCRCSELRPALTISAWVGTSPSGILDLLETRGMDRMAAGVLQSILVLGWVYTVGGRYQEARLIYRTSLDTLLKHGRQENNAVAVLLGSLAQVDRAQGRLAESARLQKKSLEMLRRIHGTKANSDVAMSLCSLAQVYRAQGHLDDSVSLHKESLDILRTIHGEKDHADVAVSLWSLAQVYRVKGWLSDSALREEESLAMKRRLHGNQAHSEVAASLCSLAQVYRTQGRLDESVPLEEESLAMALRIHGTNDHSEVAASLCSLGQVYKVRGQLGESASLQEESLAMKRRIHEHKDHSEVAASLCSLAQVYMVQGRWRESASLQEEALAMKTRVHARRDHSDVAVSLCSLAQVYRLQGRFDDSILLQEESLAMKRRIHGQSPHSDVAVSLCSLAQVHRAQGRLDKSAQLEEESLAMERRIHGPDTDHRELAASMWSLAQVYRAQGKLAWSALLEEGSFAMSQRIHGHKDHYDLAASLGSLAQLYWAQRLYKKSLTFQRESVAMLRRIHGPSGHSDLAAALGSLAQMYRARGRLVVSALLEEESLAMLRRMHGTQNHTEALRSGNGGVPPHQSGRS